MVAYGAPGLLAETLTGVNGLPVTVVDNSSRDDVRAVCEAAGVRYLDPGRNGGFGAGVNHALAAREHPGADVLLLNPDAVVSAAQVRELQGALRADPDLASVAPAQVDGTGRAQRVAWPFPSPARAWQEAVGLGRFGRQAEYVIGSVLLLRAEALEQVGGFDEAFFLYAEETDWARRASLLGWRHELVRQRDCGAPRRRHQHRPRASGQPLLCRRGAICAQAPWSGRLAVCACRATGGWQHPGARAARSPRHRTPGNGSGC